MATENSKLTRGERLQIMLAPKELEAVDEFRYAKQLPSRAAAVRELFRLGLALAAKIGLVTKQKSSDFGVLSDGPKDNLDRAKR